MNVKDLLLWRGSR